MKYRDQVPLGNRVLEKRQLSSHKSPGRRQDVLNTSFIGKPKGEHVAASSSSSVKPAKPSPKVTFNFDHRPLPSKNPEPTHSPNIFSSVLYGAPGTASNASLKTKTAEITTSSANENKTPTPVLTLFSYLPVEPKEKEVSTEAVSINAEVLVAANATAVAVANAAIDSTEVRVNTAATTTSIVSEPTEQTEQNEQMIDLTKDFSDSEDEDVQLLFERKKKNRNLQKTATDVSVEVPKNTSTSKSTEIDGKNDHPKGWTLLNVDGPEVDGAPKPAKESTGAIPKRFSFVSDPIPEMAPKNSNQAKTASPTATALVELSHLMDKHGKIDATKQSELDEELQVESMRLVDETAAGKPLSTATAEPPMEPKAIREQLSKPTKPIGKL